jgi:NAD(P)-dependent dehydrogenase (short-subunit alcohol dehydrogenase family)
MLPFTPDEWNACVKVLQALAKSPELADDSDIVKGLVTKIGKRARKNKRQKEQQERRTHDRKVLSQTLRHRIETTSDEPALPALSSEPPKLRSNKNCYICKTPYQKIHFFYAALCPDCADFNYAKRDQRCDLRGRRALVTGGRIKIGYLTALRFLRDGAQVTVLTRFPQDCLSRYSRAPDFPDWSNRLKICGLDLRNLPALERFIQCFCEQEPWLDILVNNAAQTIKRPADFYRHLIAGEAAPMEALPETLRQCLVAVPGGNEVAPALLPDGILSQNPQFPADRFDRHGQQIDLRPQNSWSLGLDEVGLTEMLEVQLVNVTAPFLLSSRLKHKLLQSPFERRFVVQVSAVEGQFGRNYKTPFHPHTNMAKAALNMMTRTAAEQYAAENIYMNSVDTGWITEENPEPKKQKMLGRGFVPPLDETDGMARIYDPIVEGITTKTTPIFGRFLKDYKPCPW